MDRFRTAALAGAALCAVLATTLAAQRAAAPPANSIAATTAQIVTASQAVLATLDAAGRAKVQFPFDSPQKQKWSNLPSPMYQRDGVRLTDLTAAQRESIMKLLQVALSAEGYQKVRRHHEGRRSVRALVGRRRTRRTADPSFGELEYYLAFVGTPSTTAPVDADVRRPSPGDQSDDGRQPGDDGAESSRGAAGDRSPLKAARCGRSATRTTRPLR